MLEPPRPPDESTRLATLRAMKLLDTAREERFDRITRLASRLFDVPMAMVSLVDSDRQWFKSSFGVEFAETPRAWSFCGHAILTNELFLVPDARLDPRFADNPLVVNPPEVRFYAGQPIRAADGSRLGTLCLLDRRPRTLDAEARRDLADLAAWVESEVNGVEQGLALALSRENESRIRRVLDGLRDAILTVNSRGQVDGYSRGAAVTFGHPADAIIGRDPRDLMADLSADPLPPWIIRALSPVDTRPAEMEGELRGRRRGGAIFPMFVSIRQSEDGRLILIARDVTDQKRAEEARRESEARLRSLAEEQGMILEHSSDFVYRHDTEGVFNYLSPAVEQITGRTPEEWKRHYSSYMTDHPDNAQVYAYTEQTLRTGKQSPPYLVEVFHRDGHRVMLEVNERAYFEGDRIAGIVGVARDVTERVRAERDLHDSQRRYADLVREAADPIVSLDLEGRFTSFNPAAEATSGYRMDEVVGRTFPEVGLIFPDDLPLVREEFDRVLGGEERRPFELRCRTRSGALITLEANAHQIRRDGDARGVQVILRDVTDRKRGERMKDEFISTVSHELRTPLTSIVGALGLVAGEVTGDLPPQLRGLIDIARKNGERLVRLINDILDLERIKSGILEVNLTSLDLARLVEQAVEINRPLAQRNRVRFEINGPPQGIVLKTDGDRLLQVLTNLLSNGAKYSPPGGTVTISIERVDGVVRLEVRDGGRGVPESFRTRLFEKFAQADTSDAGRRGGTGLGLSISKAIVDRLGGTIQYLGKAGTGAIFRVEFPDARE